MAEPPRNVSIPPRNPSMGKQLPTMGKRLPSAAALAPWVLAGVFVLVSMTTIVTVKKLRADLQGERSRVAALSRDLEAERRWSLALTGPGVKTASFSLTPSGDLSLRARATVDPDSRKALVVFEGTKPPGGQVYELWALRGNTPVSLGAIRTDASGRAVMRIEDMGEVQTVNAFAISIEPEGGSAGSSGAAGSAGAAPSGGAAGAAGVAGAVPREPTGPIVMFGSLG